MSRLLLMLVSLFMSANLFAQAEEKIDARKDVDVPFKNAMDALKEQKFDEVLDWLAKVEKDFPLSKRNPEARVISLTVLVAQEIASLKVSNLFNESLKWAVDKNPRDKGKEYLTVQKQYETRAENASKAMSTEARELLNSDRGSLSEKIKLDININTQGWDVSALRETLNKGEILDASETSRLYAGEVLTSFLAFLSEIIEPAPENILTGVFLGDIDRVKLYRSLGDRFLINAKREARDSKFQDLAKSCFDKAVDLTNETPYSKERNLAMKGLEGLKSLGELKKPAVICPKCGRVMDKEWIYCPFDGSKFSDKKK